MAQGPNSGPTCRPARHIRTACRCFDRGRSPSRATERPEERQGTLPAIQGHIEIYCAAGWSHTWEQRLLLTRGCGACTRARAYLSVCVVAVVVVYGRRWWWCCCCCYCCCSWCSSWWCWWCWCWWCWWCGVNDSFANDCAAFNIAQPPRVPPRAQQRRMRCRARLAAGTRRGRAAPEPPQRGSARRALSRGARAARVSTRRRGGGRLRRRAAPGRGARPRPAARLKRAPPARWRPPYAAMARRACARADEALAGGPAAQQAAARRRASPAADGSGCGSRGRCARAAAARSGTTYGRAPAQTRR
mmetsp:Transcript_991/g.2258  ORF Transcript_991/g.2258 Transcript_991/m.2258 type:complete len:303 (+) Transcript_991:281-1189(+)